MLTAIASMSASAIRRAPRDRAEIGLLDVRPEGRIAAGHPLFAAPFPLGRPEAGVFDRLPRRSAGGELFADVSAPSKAFGELVAATAGTPDVTAQDLQAMLRDQEDVVVVDVRRFEEYQTMSIPTATDVLGPSWPCGSARWPPTRPPFRPAAPLSDAKILFAHRHSRI